MSTAATIKVVDGENVRFALLHSDGYPDYVRPLLEGMFKDWDCDELDATAFRDLLIEWGEENKGRAIQNQFQVLPRNRVSEPWVDYRYLVDLVKGTVLGYDDFL